MSSGSAGVGVAAAGRNASLSNDELLLESMQQKSALPILKYLVESVWNGPNGLSLSESHESGPTCVASLMGSSSMMAPGFAVD